jgi:hypothetical protein
VQTEVCRLSVFCEETNGSYPFANGLNGLAYLCIKVKEACFTVKKNIKGVVYILPIINIVQHNYPVLLLLYYHSSNLLLAMQKNLL